MTELGLIEGIIVIIALGGLACLIWLKHMQDEQIEMRRDIMELWKQVYGPKGKNRATGAIP